MRQFFILLFAGLFATATGLLAQTDEIPNLFVTPLVTSGLNNPVDIAYVPGDSSRIFIVEQPGRIRVFDLEEGELLSDPYLNITNIVNDNGWEQGLLGLAFHPNFMTNGRFFVNYTSSPQNGVPNGATVIAEYSITDPMSNTGATGGGRILIIDQPFGNHNGGCIKFGPDGYLYIGTGDGGSGGDPDGYGQNPSTLLGKMLRIDVDFAGGSLYGIPADNPFSGGDTLREIWAMGMRNPWRFSFDRETNDMWVGDVGQNAREEINMEPAGSSGGLDYGWNCREGKIGFSSGSDDCDPEDVYVDPVVDFNRNEAFSITGGFVYRGEDYGAIQGWYICADLSRNWFLIRQDDEGNWEDFRQFISEVGTPSTFGEDAAGELYVADLDGAIYRVGADPLSSTSFQLGSEANFSVFPNPSDGRIKLRLEDGVSGDIQASLYDLQGRQLCSRVWEAATGEFSDSWDLGKLPVGTYQLQLRRDGLIYRAKVVLE